MSRDWRPFEAVIADEEAHITRGEYIHDAKFVMHYPKTGKECPMYKEEPRGPFPNLCYLLDGFELKTYDEIKEDHKAYAFYEYVESQIGRLSDTIRKQMQNNERLNLDQVDVADPVIKDWFMGELDQNFYYNEVNNEEFREWIGRQIAKSKDPFALEEVIFYSTENGNEYAAENLYCMLYYNFIDASESHIAWRVMSQIDGWTEEEVIDKCTDLINSIMEQEKLTKDEFFKNYQFPESVRPAVDKIMENFEKTEPDLEKE